MGSTGRHHDAHCYVIFVRAAIRPQASELTYNELLAKLLGPAL
jgi:hypothetical protein